MERLTSEQLKKEQEKTLAAPRMRYGLLARLLFVSMDLLYGRTKTLAKFRVLEIIARMPTRLGRTSPISRSLMPMPTLISPGASSNGCGRAGLNKTTSSGIC